MMPLRFDLHIPENCLDVYKMAFRSVMFVWDCRHDESAGKALNSAYWHES